MADLISKDKVLRCLKESSEHIDWGQSEDGDAFKHYVGANYRTIAEFKPEQPEIVRCKDCRYWRPNTEFCGRWTFGWIAHRTPENWYCADGEVKQDAEA